MYDILFLIIIEVCMSKREKIEELSKKLDDKFEEKDSLKTKIQQVIQKAKELTTSLENTEKSHDNCRKSALICSLLCGFTMQFIPFIGMWFALLPIGLLTTTIVQSIRMFVKETKIDKTKKQCEMCNELLKSYNESLTTIDLDIDGIHEEIKSIIKPNQTNNTNTTTKLITNEIPTDKKSTI